MNKKTIVFLGLGGLASLLVENNLDAEEVSLKEKEKTGISLLKETLIIKPTLEEITTLLSKEPIEILQPAIERGEIKKFEYTRQTKLEDFYKFLKENFQQRIIFVYLVTDKSTDSNIKIAGLSTEKATFDRQFGSGSAIAFLYTNLNLKNTSSDVGFLFLEIKDFYGKDNWAKLNGIFNRNGLEFPSIVDFVNDGQKYNFAGINEAGFKSPGVINENLKMWVDYYSKK